MSCFTAGWLRLVLAGAVAVTVPALLADRLLPDNRERAAGVVTDVFAVTWLSAAVLMAGVGVTTGVTGDLLREQGERFEVAGFHKLSGATYWLADGPAWGAGFGVSARSGRGSSGPFARTGDEGSGRDNFRRRGRAV